MATFETVDLGAGRSVTLRISVAMQARYLRILRLVQSELPDDLPAEARNHQVALALVEHGPELARGHVVGSDGLGAGDPAEALLAADLPTQIEAFAAAVGLLFPQEPADETAEADGLDPTASVTV